MVLRTRHGVVLFEGIGDVQRAVEIGLLCWLASDRALGRSDHWGLAPLCDLVGYKGAVQAVLESGGKLLAA